MAQVPVSRISARNIALGMLVPKLLGILWETGTAQEQGAKATFDRDLEIGASFFRADGVALSVWSPSAKVLSLHLAADPAAVDPQSFRYQSGRCSVLNWDRGSWEHQIMASAARPRQIVQIFMSGLA
jgi:hypothetical protein